MERRNFNPGYAIDDTAKQIRLLDIEQELREIEVANFQPGHETIPHSDASWDSWKYAHASSWVTLYRPGGFEAQPRWWLEDMQWFNTLNYYYQLKGEADKIRAELGVG